ncbi:EamA family transporter [Micropruina sonneratiae]|uniref:EamA family transporter n=1 Tax=Micropruina sonneratiae TaxID=2986940 RepID=UPI0022277927|nr:EamA family transporter [Micropruina sp. KQZ13P-5]MCW3159246.1 EamA family transporter [Micropruina sp. KQZ13P-5]
MRTALTRIDPVWLVLIAIASVQLGAAFAKDLFATTTPTATAWLRLCFASLIFLTFARPRLRGRSAREWLIALGYGLALAGMNWAIYASFARIPIGVAVTIEFLGPLGVAVATSRRLRDLLWVALAALGVALLGLQPVDPDWIGLGLAVLAGALWAGYILLAGPTGRHFEGVSGVTLASVVGAVLLAPFAFALGTPVFNTHVLLVALAVGLLSSVIPYGLEMVALRRLKPGLFGILMSLEPAAAALFALLVLGEGLTVIECAAMACVIFASVGATRSRSREDPELRD